MAADLVKASDKESGRERPKGALVWIAAMLPLVPLIVAYAIEPAPTGPGVVSLAGDGWRLLDGDTDVPEGDRVAFANVELDDSAWRAFEIPSGWSRDGVKSTSGWLRRHFALPEHLRERDLHLVVPNIRGGLARVFVNGQLVGTKGVPEADVVFEETALDGYSVPASLLRAHNVLALQVRFPAYGHDGFPDRRFLIGDPAVVKSYLTTRVSIKHVLEHGALALNLFGIVMMLALLRLQSGNRALYRASLITMAAVALYLSGKTGVPTAFFLSAEGVNDFIPYTVIGVALATPELIEVYYVKRRTWFRVVNRGVCALALILSLPFDINTVYPPFSPWFFAVIVHAMFFAIRDLIRPQTALGPVLASAMACTAFAAGNDIVNDLDFLYTARLFTFAVANLGIVAVVLVLSELILVSRALATKNAALVDALAKAEESARLKSEFLANTSHELRTPLNAILNIPQGLLDEIEERSVIVCRKCQSLFEAEGDADAASAALGEPCPSCGAAELCFEVRRFAPDNADDLERHLRGVIGAGRHLLAVVDDILDFSKLDAGKMKLDVAEVSLADVVERATATLKPIAEGAGVSLAVAPVPAVLMSADGTRLAQVLINLLANAVKFSPKGGTVEIESELDAARDHVVIRVRDEGPGIAPQHHAMIFESFRQVEGGHTRKHGGTGLGLAIVKKIVELHGGTVSVDSQLGKGSLFTVTVPRMAASAATLPARIEPGSDAVAQRGPSQVE